jgi:hypothetical protein
MNLSEDFFSYNGKKEKGFWESLLLAFHCSWSFFLFLAFLRQVEVKAEEKGCGEKSPAQNYAPENFTCRKFHT